MLAKNHCGRRKLTGLLPPLSAQPSSHTHRHRTPELRTKPIRGYEHRFRPECTNARDFGPAQLHLARELVDDSSVGGGTHADCLCLRFRRQPGGFRLCLGLDLQLLSLGFGAGDDLVGRRVRLGLGGRKISTWAMWLKSAGMD